MKFYHTRQSVCPLSPAHFHLASYYKKMEKTSLTHSIRRKRIAVYFSDI